MNEFPREKYIELENNPYLMGRLTIHHVKQEYHVEVDIIHKESHKIFKHVDIIYHLHGADEAQISGVQRLRTFLERVEQDTSDQEDPLH